MNEQDWTSGNRAAWAHMLQTCLSQLGGEDRNRDSWRLEREAAIAALRRICEEHGDNDWPEDLHLADIIEKHLADHLLA